MRNACSAYVDRYAFAVAVFCPVRALLRVQHPLLEMSGGVRMTNYVPGAYRTDAYEHQDLRPSPAFNPIHVLLCE